MPNLFEEARFNPDAQRVVFLSLLSPFSLTLGVASFREARAEDSSMMSWPFAVAVFQRAHLSNAHQAVLVMVSQLATRALHKTLIFIPHVGFNLLHFFIAFPRMSTILRFCFRHAAAFADFRPIIVQVIAVLTFPHFLSPFDNPEVLPEAPPPIIPQSTGL